MNSAQLAELFTPSKSAGAVRGVLAETVQGWIDHCKQIASTFRELDLIEKYGSGVRRVIDTFVAYGLPEPEFEATQGGMAVTVFRRPKHPNDDGVKLLAALIGQRPGQRTPALAKALGTSQKNIERWLQQLKAQGLVEFRGTPKTGGYHATTGSAAAQQGEAKF